MHNATINGVAVTTASNSAGISEVGLRDLLLHALTVSSGAVDAISFLALGKVFSAFMTGNIAFLGLRIARVGNAIYARDSDGGSGIGATAARFTGAVDCAADVIHTQKPVALSVRHSWPSSRLPVTERNPKF